MAGPGFGPMDANALRNFKEFLETYNKISEICFQRCVLNLNERELSKQEANCCDNCTVKNIGLNHKILNAFMVEQPRITEQKLEKAQKEAEEVMKKMQAQGIDAENLSPEEMASRMMSGMQSSVPNPNQSQS